MLIFFIIVFCDQFCVRFTHYCITVLISAGSLTSYGLFCYFGILMFNFELILCEFEWVGVHMLKILPDCCEFWFFGFYVYVNSNRVFFFGFDSVGFGS